MSEIVPGSVGPEIGFAGTDPVTGGLLARYLVGRVVAARVSMSLLITALVVLAGALVVWVWGPHWLAVLVGLLALVVLGFRALLVAILRRIMGVGRLGPAEGRVRALVSDTQGDLRRELRRIGLPATVFGMPLLMIRLLGRHRSATFAQLKRVDVNRVVSRSRQDELRLLVTARLVESQRVASQRVTTPRRHHR